MASIDNDVKQIPEVSNTKYYFVRTEKGEFYNTFRDNGFIALGWNEINSNDIIGFEGKQESLKIKLIKNPRNRFDRLKPTAQKIQATTILNKIKTFRDLQEGDVIIIPSKSSKFLSFGVVKGEDMYFREDNLCVYNKRRDIKWIKDEKISQLDAKFGYITTSSHAISKIDDKYESIIQNVMYDSYLKDGVANISIKIKKQDDIDYFKLVSFLNDIIKIADQIDHIEGCKVEEKVIVKLNVQSQGFVNLMRAGSIGLITAFSIVAIGCENNKKGISNDGIIQQHNVDTTTFNNAMQLYEELEVKKTK